MVLIAVGVGLAWRQPWQSGSGTARGEQTIPAQHDRPSIVALSFENFSGDEEQEYFADGMTEDLITDKTRSSTPS